MSANGDDTLDINLRQNLDTEGEKAAGGLEKAAAAYDKLVTTGEKGEGLEHPLAGLVVASKAVSSALREQSSLQAKIAGFDSDRARKVAELKAQYAALNREAAKGVEDPLTAARAASQKAGGKGGGDAGFGFLQKAIPTDLLSSLKPPGGFQQLVQEAGRIFGPGGADAVMGAGKFLSEAGPGLAVAGGAIAAGGAVILAAAAALGAVAVKLLIAGAQIAIAESTFKQGAVGAFDRKTGGKGEAQYQQTLGLAAKLGLTKEDAVEQTKVLLQAQVSREQIPLAITAIADISVDDPSKGAALKEKIAQFGRGKKVDEGAIRGLAEAGVNVNDVFDALKKKGESTDQVIARLKTNGVSAAEAIKATISAVEKGSGGAAAKAAESIPGLINRLKIGFGSLFDSVDLAPIKDALTSVASVLEGPVGAEFKTSLTGLFGQLFHTLFDPFKGPEGQKKLEALFKTISSAATETTAALKALAPLVQVLVDVSTAIGGSGKDATQGSPVLAFLKALVQGFVGLTSAQPQLVLDSVRTLLDMAGQLAGIDASGAAQGIGTGIVDGIISGITSGAAGVVQSITSLATTAITAAKTAFDQHSPSKVFESIGHNNALGLVGGHEKGGAAVAVSGANLAGGAIGAANSNGLAGGGAGGGMVIHFAPQIVLPAGSSAEVRAAAQAGVEASYPMFEANMRRWMRNRGEAAAA